MKNLIDKAAVVAEIERLYNSEYTNDSDLSCGKKIILRYILSFLDTLEVKDNSLEKFKSLQHISRDLRSTLQDWGYTPNLYHFDGSWHVDWIHCEEGDSIEGFTAETPEEAIDKAYNWFHSKFCNG